MHRTLRLRHSAQLFVPRRRRFDGRSLEVLLGVCMMAGLPFPSWTEGKGVEVDAEGFECGLVRRELA
jgi:hypothetical protein